MAGLPWWRRPLPQRARMPLLIAGGLLALVGLSHGLREYRLHMEQAHAQRAAAEATAQARKAADCRRNARCWGQRHWAEATTACRRRVERAARYAVRWPTGLLNPAFVHWEWRDQPAGTLVYVGRAELQNGFGAWEPHIIGCLYGSESRQAIEIELRPGRL